MFKYGNWEIEIDEGKTKSYYASLPFIDTQSNRNFLKNAEQFTEEEKAFFNSLYVDIAKLTIDGALNVSTYLKKKLYWGCNADIYVFGNIVFSPEVEKITIEDVKNNGVEILDDRETGEIKVGRFEFSIQNPNDSVPDQDCPDGAIYISMDYAELDWLLNEKCEETVTEGLSAFSEIKWTLHSLFLGRIEEKRERIALTEKILNYFAGLGLKFVPFSNKQTLEYKKEWVNNYTDNPEIASFALPSRKSHNLLWHVFSFEEGKAIEGENARISYDNICRNNVVIYIDDVDTAFKAYDIEALTSSEIEKMCSDEVTDFGNMDIIVTSMDFSWTYCRTHESGWIGPYFYKK